MADRRTRCASPGSTSTPPGPHRPLSRRHNRERQGLRQALAACRIGETLVVTKPDRLARSLADARAIADELTAAQVKRDLGGSVREPTDPSSPSSAPGRKPTV
jgi:hypothetical protein